MLTLEEKLNILLDAAEEAAKRSVAFRTLHEEFKVMGPEYRDADFEAWIIFMDSSHVESWLSSAAKALHAAEYGSPFVKSPLSEMLYTRTQAILAIKIKAAESFK